MRVKAVPPVGSHDMFGFTFNAVICNKGEKKEKKGVKVLLCRQSQIRVS